MKRGDDGLYLHEEILLLALRDDRGTIPFGTMYQLAIAGAILAELLLEERIALDEGRRRLVGVISEKPIGEPILDEALERMASSSRRASIASWVQRLSRTRKLKERVARGLCDRRILRADEDAVLLIFRRKIYPELNPRPERRVVERLRRAIFTNTRDVDRRTAALIALADKTGLLKTPFDRRRLRERKGRIKELTADTAVGAALAVAIKRIRASRAAAVSAAG